MKSKKYGVSEHQTTKLEEIAKAIEGPDDPQGIYKGDPAKLTMLRNIRWGRLTDQDRGVRLEEARAALENLKLLSPKMFERANELEVKYKKQLKSFEVVGFCALTYQAIIQAALDV